MKYTKAVRGKVGVEIDLLTYQTGAAGGVRGDNYMEEVRARIVEIPK